MRDTRANPLIERAKRLCKGCRVVWRLDGWKHRKPSSAICTAQNERQQLRDIAAELRRNEKRA